jgi:hypothetical protein
MVKSLFKLKLELVKMENFMLTSLKREILSLRMQSGGLWRLYKERKEPH